jgi:hypothetical protein
MATNRDQDAAVRPDLAVVPHELEGGGRRAELVGSQAVLPITAGRHLGQTIGVG